MLLFFKGGNGGNAGNGHNGKDGQNASEDNKVGFWYVGYSHTRGEEGTRGGDGGVGGNAGLGAYGGHAGHVIIKENKFSMVDDYDTLIEAKDKSSTAADDGKPGEGGKGGVGGTNGNDVIFYDKYGFGNKCFRGHFEVTYARDGFWSFDLRFEERHRPKKRDGIHKSRGQTADQQVNR